MTIGGIGSASAPIIISDEEDEEEMQVQQYLIGHSSTGSQSSCGGAATEGGSHSSRSSSDCPLNRKRKRTTAVSTAGPSRKALRPGTKVASVAATAPPAGTHSTQAQPSGHTNKQRKQKRAVTKDALDTHALATAELWQETLSPNSIWFTSPVWGSWPNSAVPVVDMGTLTPPPSYAPSFPLPPKPSAFTTSMAHILSEPASASPSTSILAEHPVILAQEPPAPMKEVPAEVAPTCRKLIGMRLDNKPSSANRGIFHSLIKNSALPDTSRSLVMELLPRRWRDFTFVQSWAIRFDEQPVRVELDNKVGKALIEFRTVDAAKAAFHSPRLSVDGKEHIRVWWYRLDPALKDLEEGEVYEPAAPQAGPSNINQLGKKAKKTQRAKEQAAVQASAKPVSAKSAPVARQKPPPPSQITPAPFQTHPQPLPLPSWLQRAQQSVKMDDQPWYFGPHSTHSGDRPRSSAPSSGPPVLLNVDLGPASSFQSPSPPSQDTSDDALEDVMESLYDQHGYNDDVEMDLETEDGFEPDGSLTTSHIHLNHPTYSDSRLSSTEPIEVDDDGFEADGSRSRLSRLLAAEARQRHKPGHSKERDTAPSSSSRKPVQDSRDYSDDDQSIASSRHSSPAPTAQKDMKAPGSDASKTSGLDTSASSLSRMTGSRITTRSTIHQVTSVSELRTVHSASDISTCPLPTTTAVSSPAASKTTLPANSTLRVTTAAPLAVSHQPSHPTASPVAIFRQSQPALSTSHVGVNAPKAGSDNVTKPDNFCRAMSPLDLIEAFSPKGSAEILIAPPSMGQPAPVAAMPMETMLDPFAKPFSPSLSSDKPPIASGSTSTPPGSSTSQSSIPSESSSMPLPPSKRALSARQKDIEERIAQAKAELAQKATTAQVLPTPSVSALSPQSAPAAITASPPSSPAVMTVTVQRTQKQEVDLDKLRRSVVQNRRKRVESAKPAAMTDMTPAATSTEWSGQPSTSHPPLYQTVSVPAPTAATAASRRTPTPPIPATSVSTTTAALDDPTTPSLNDIAASFISDAIQQAQAQPLRHQPSTEKVLLAAKQKRLEQHIAETKVLMAKLSAAKTREEKDSIMSILREQTRAMDEDLKLQSQAASMLSPRPLSQLATASAQARRMCWPETAQSSCVLIISDDEDEDDVEMS